MRLQRADNGTVPVEHQPGRLNAAQLIEQRVGDRFGLHAATLMVAVGYLRFCVLDLSGQQLDADPERLCGERQRAVHICGQLAGHHLQSHLPYRLIHITSAAYLTTGMARAHSTTDRYSMTSSPRLACGAGTSHRIG